MTASNSVLRGWGLAAAVSLAALSTGLHAQAAAEPAQVPGPAPTPVPTQVQGNAPAQGGNVPVSILPEPDPNAPRETAPDTSIARIELAAPGIDRLGLVSTGKGGFAPDLWTGTDPGFLKQILSLFPARVNSPAQRRLAQGELRTVQDMEARARHDSAYFAASLGKLNDTEWRAFTSFLAQTKNAAVAPLAHATFGKLPREQTKPWRTELAKAQLPQIRLLAEE